MLDFGGADAVREAAKSAVGGRVRITADHRHARQREALLRPHHMHDALALVIDGELDDAEVAAVFVQRGDLDARGLVGNAGHALFTFGAVGGHVVVGRRDIGVQAPGLAAGELEALKGLRAGDFVQQLAVDIDEAGAVITLLYKMVVPELVVEGLAGHLGLLAHGGGLGDAGMLGRLDQ